MSRPWAGALLAALLAGAALPALSQPPAGEAPGPLPSPAPQAGPPDPPGPEPSLVETGAPGNDGQGAPGPALAQAAAQGAAGCGGEPATVTAWEERRREAWIPPEAVERLRGLLGPDAVPGPEHLALVVHVDETARVRIHVQCEAALGATGGGGP